MLSMILSTALASDAPNVLLITLDDISNEYVGVYGEGPDAEQPPTPHLDAFAASGLLFHNAYANPLCSPTRATLMTGRYAYRTGIGAPIGPTKDQGLAFSEVTLPEALPSPYVSILLGKWHLGQQVGPLDPVLHGFAGWDGTIGNFEGGDDFFRWTRSIAFPWRWFTLDEPQYATTWLTDRTAATLPLLPEPWCASVNYHAPHNPIHWPPGFGGGGDKAAQYRAMIEFLDTELGRLFATLDFEDTVVIVLGDNGTKGTFSYPPKQGKRTLYEGGVNVPFLVRGPGVAVGAQTDALINTTDVFATAIDLAGGQSVAEDSISFVPVLRDPTATTRDWVYFEQFNAEPTDERGAREARFKLVRDFITGTESLYDLSTAIPGQDGSPIPPSTWGQDEQDAYNLLRPVLDAPDL